MTQPEQPFLRVVRGEPDAAELAALLVALRSRAAAPAPDRAPPSRWSEPAARLRRPLTPAAGGWRWSAAPGAS